LKDEKRGKGRSPAAYLRKPEAGVLFLVVILTRHPLKRKNVITNFANVDIFAQPLFASISTALQSGQ
jgi:hypothetical protein